MLSWVLFQVSSSPSAIARLNMRSSGSSSGSDDTGSEGTSHASSSMPADDYADLICSLVRALSCLPGIRNVGLERLDSSMLTRIERLRYVPISKPRNFFTRRAGQSKLTVAYLYSSLHDTGSHS